jgi:transcription antitermination factor NusA-like protein
LTGEKLCKECKEKLDTGMINQEEIEVSRAIHALGRSNKLLKGVEIKNVVDVGKVFVVADQLNASKLIGPGGATVKTISEKIGKPVRIIAEPKRDKDFLSHLLGDVPILNVNILYKDSGEYYRVCIDEMHRRRVMLSPENFSKAIRRLTNKEMELVFE